MKLMQSVKVVVLSGLLMFPCLQSVSFAGDGLASGDCGQAVELLKKQNKKLSREFGQLKREITSLHQALENPGFKDIVGGIGYILGVFGVAAYVAARKGGRG